MLEDSKAVGSMVLGMGVGMVLGSNVVLVEDSKDHNKDRCCSSNQLKQQIQLQEPQMMIRIFS
jgi:hypothetical protein